MSAPDDLHGLPAPLPPGERVLWQGRPQWWPLCVQALHVRKVALYFALLMGWGIAAAAADSAALAASARSAAWLLMPAGLAVGVLMLIGWLMARTTRYTITSARVILQYGVALPMTLHIPLRRIGSAALKIHRDGSGAIPLATSGDDRLAYLMLWPHVRPWRLKRAEPMLRALAEPKHVASILAQALKKAVGEGVRAAPAGADAEAAKPSLAGVAA